MHQNMTFDAILLAAIQLEKIAGSQGLMSLRNQKYPGTELLYSEFMAERNDDLQHFAIFDRKNQVNIQNVMDWLDSEELPRYYLEHPKVQNLIDFIVRSYNQHFPEKDGWQVYEHLQGDGLDYDTTGGYVSNTPIFLLIHDLIHQILESDFVSTLQTQKDIGDQTSLSDEINEDLASTLTNFQPNPFLFNYLQRNFIQFLDKNNVNISSLKQAIDATFHKAKAELRNKLETIAPQIDPELLEKIQNSPAISGRVKQLIDGVLSKIKHEMMQNVDYVDSLYQGNQIGYNRTFASIWDAFDLSDLKVEYQERLQQAEVLDPQDSIKLRNWILTCLKEMQKVYQYFQREFEQEFHSPEDDYQDNPDSY